MIVNNWFKITALLFAIFLISQAFNVEAKIDQKIDRQKHAIEKIKKWDKQYDNLLPIKKKWQERYDNIVEINDILELYNTLNIENTPLTMDVEKMQIQRIKKEKYNNQDIGLVNLYITSNRRDAVQFRAENIKDILDGLKILDNNNIDIGNVRLQYKEKNNEIFANAMITDFKVKYRNKVLADDE